VKPESPTPAERVRTVLERPAEIQVVVRADQPVGCQFHHLLRDGRVALIVAESCGAAGGGRGVLEVLDRSPTPDTDAMRALVWVFGRLRVAQPAELGATLDLIAASRADPALLDVGHGSVLVFLQTDAIVYADAAGAGCVEVGDLLAAPSDPFGQTEAAWLRYLHRDHPEMIERLRFRLPPGRRRGRVILLGLDRSGLLVRVEGPNGRSDVRVPFLTPAVDDVILGRALRSLMSCPFSNGFGAGPR
jgi:hypothetical protein